MNRQRMVIDIPAEPPRPWLRLAHVARFAAPGMAAGVRRLGDWEFVVILSGATWLEVAGGTGRMAMPAGSIALIPPGIGFDWGLERHSHLAVHFDLHAAAKPTTGAAITYLDGTLAGVPARGVAAWTLRCGQTASPVPFIRDGSQLGTWRERLSPLVRLWSRGGPRSLDDRLRAGGILSAALADWLALGPGRPGAAGVERVRQWVDGLATTSADRPYDIPSLARQCGLGVVAFRNAFRVVTGQSPRRWLEHRRIDAVRGMLADPRVPVADAARLAGFADPFHFARVVRRVTGRPPSALRRRSDG
jgi:AraC-like DNA-binding protein